MNDKDIIIKRNNTQVVRVRGAANLLSCSVSQVWHLTKIGDIKSIKLSDRITVWLESEIEEYIYSKMEA